MSKKNLAKRLIALIAIVAMFAAMTITASAANYSSTTMYVNDTTVKVSTAVTGLTDGDEVTYYAKGTNGDVYVNQYTADGVSMTKDYVADTEDIDGLVIKMAKVSEAFDAYEEIKGTNKGSVTFAWGALAASYSDDFPAVDEIIALGKVADSIKISSLTATVGGSEVAVPVVIDADNNVSIINPFTFAKVDETITVTWAGGTYSSAVVGIKLESENGYTPVADVQFFENKIYFEDEYSFVDEENETVTGKLFAVLYEVKLPADAKEVGIEIKEGETWVPLKAYGTLAGDTQKFAIAIVDAELEYGFEYRAYCKISDTETVYDTVKTANAKYAEQ